MGGEKRERETSEGRQFMAGRLPDSGQVVNAHPGRVLPKGESATKPVRYSGVPLEEATAAFSSSYLRSVSCYSLSL